MLQRTHVLIKYADLGVGSLPTSVTEMLLWLNL